MWRQPPRLSIERSSIGFGVVVVQKSGPAARGQPRAAVPTQAIFLLFLFLMESARACPPLYALPCRGELVAHLPMGRFSRYAVLAWRRRSCRRARWCAPTILRESR